MIVYRKGGSVRLLRHTSPDPPFWAAGTVLPYSTRRSTPVQVDWVNLVASGSEIEQVEIADDAGESIARAPYLHPPLLLDATGAAESVYRRGEQVARAAVAAGLPILELITTDGAVPEIADDRLTLAIAFWPPEPGALDQAALAAGRIGARFGIVVPVIPPSTTELSLLTEVAAIAAARGARFLAAVPVDVDPAVRRILAEAGRVDEEEFSSLFESDLELLTVATERHVAALAQENGIPDLVPVALPRPSNWAAASALASTGNRMIRMNRDVELGWEILRASRTISALSKPLARIADAASLSIIDPLDPLIAGALEEWLESGRSALMDEIDRAWRLRRDYLVASAP
ncbi:MAG TPA: hypothetical protein VMS56_14285 [Thermoanaerobaculia bacterium]|nr:hypothetical protein [Thermoanaerobaculia bacterium]